MKLKLLYFFQINKLLLLLTNISINSSEILAVKSILFDQLHFLTEKFKNLTSDDSYDHEETNVKCVDTATNTKHISLLKNIDELVCNK